LTDDNKNVGSTKYGHSIIRDRTLALVTLMP
jgi:hypothetical protein